MQLQRLHTETVTAMERKRPMVMMITMMDISTMAIDARCQGTDGEA